MSKRIILLLDLDSFFASAEEQRNPDLKGKAIAICMLSGRTKDSGAIATANYKAREIGIHAGIYIQKAKRLAYEAELDVAFVPADRKYYTEVSDKIMKIIEKEADAFQQVSIDEAYLDVTKKTNGDYKKAENLANEIKRKVKKRTGLTCSIGIGPNKTVAKMAASVNKPDGTTLIKPEKVQDFLYPLPLKKLHGIGPKTTELMAANGVETIGDFAKTSLSDLVPLLGKNRAEKMWSRARGEDDDPVEPTEKKQLGRMMTLKKDTQDPKYIEKSISPLIEDIVERLNKRKSLFRTISITVVTTKHEMKTRSVTLEKPSASSETIRINVIKLATDYMRENPNVFVRRFGLGVSNLEKTKNTGLGRFIT